MQAKDKQYQLPNSLRGNQEFVLFSNILCKRYKTGVQQIVSNPKHNPNEEYVRQMVQFLFDAEFKKVRPNWLLNDETNQPMELDGYCEVKQIAFEFQSGSHHVNDANAKYRDRLKKIVCEQRNIRLLEIWPHMHSNEILLECFIEMRSNRLVPRKSVLWYGCWINKLMNKLIYSHAFLTRESNSQKIKSTTITKSTKNSKQSP